MAVLGRLKIAPNQRLDLPDIQAFDAYSAGDWQNFLQGLTGGSPYILNGFEVFQPNTLIGNPATTADITLDSALVWWPEGGAGSFYSSLPGSTTRSITLITAATNYIEMTFVLGSTAQDARALWDPGANGGAGGEFTQVVDTEYFLDVVIARNNTGFSTDAIPISKIVVDGSNNVVSITDSRPNLFRLGSGGNSPDPLHSYSWTDDPVGFSRTDTPVTMTSPSDPNVFRGADKNIHNMKAWMDAVMTRIKEIDGGSKWFQSSGGGGGGGGGSGTISLTNLFLDSEAGNSPIPNRNVRLGWSLANDGMFRSINAPSTTGPVSWKANFGQLTWTLGGTFVGSTNRAYSAFTFASAVADQQNVYLHLQRDAALNGDPTVTFQNINGTTGSVSSGGTGAFTGVAVGDFIRKNSGSTFQYYKVVELRVSSGSAFTNGTVAGTVADGTVQYIILATHDGPILTTSENYRYFRTAYSVSDLVISQYGVYDTSYYWLGARSGTMFFLRGYGDMQPGEETEVIDDGDRARGGSGGSPLYYERAVDSIYDPTNGYSLKLGGTTTLVTIHRRSGDNEVGNPSNVDNTEGTPTYTIAAPIGLMNDGFGLWVRLGASGALTAGNVTDVTQSNVWQVLDVVNNPLANYENMNVFLVARKYTLGGVPYLVFTDGTMLSPDGQWVNNHLSVQRDLYLKEKTQWSIPFIGTTGGRVDENNAQFFWNNTAGPDSLGQFGVRNLRISEDTVNHFDVISQVVSQDLHFLPTLGAFTLTIGQNTSTTIIPGDLIVNGTSSSINTSTINITGKQIVVGVGNLNNGGGDSGLAVADNTVSATSYTSTNGQIYIDVLYPSPHGYTTGETVWTNTNTAVGGITSGEINGPYLVKVTGAVAGDAQVTGANTLRIWTHGTATSTQTETVGAGVIFQTYLTPSSILMSDSSGNTTGMTSWAFQVKGVATTPTITPVANYGIVPTANTANFNTGNIPFANADAQGPGGVDTTLNFSANLNWNNSTNTLTVGGGMSLAGNFDPAADNVYNLGETNLRWKTLHVGPGSVVVHNDATNTNLSKLDFNGATARFVTDAATPMQIATGANSGMSMDTTGRVGWFGAVSTDTSFYFIQSSVIASGTAQYGVRISSLLNGTTETNNLHAQGIVQTNTIANASNVRVANMTTAAGATITTQYGVRIDDLTTGGTNYGVFSAMTVSAATKWFLYGSGSAPSYLSAGLGLGNNTASVNSQRLLLGTTADTTAAGGISFGTDTTLYRSAAGVLSTNASLNPVTDNTQILGTSALRWNSLNLGPTGLVVHNDATNTTKVSLDFVSTVATLVTDATTPLNVTTGANPGISISIAGLIGLGGPAANGQVTVGTNTTAAAGGIYFGTDTNLYRLGVTTLATDVNFSVGLNLNLVTTTATAGQITQAGSRLLHTFGGTSNLWIGTGAGNFTTTGTSNVGVGQNVMQSQANAGNNTGIGANSLAASTTSHNNTALGSGALTALINGTDNVALGYLAGSGMTAGTAVGNTMIGSQTGTGVMTGTNNVLLGFNTGNFLIGGSNNTILGAGVTGLSASLASNIILANGTGAIKAQHDATNWNITGSMNPTADATYDLGTTTGPFRWRNLFLSGSVTVTGAINVNVSGVKTTTYTALVTDGLIQVDTTAGAVTINLPAANATNKGQWLMISDVGGAVTQSGKAITVTPNGTDKLGGVNASVTLNFSNFNTLALISNGSGSWIVT